MGLASKQFGSSEKKISFNLFIGVCALAAVLLIALVFVYLDSSTKSSAVASSSVLTDSTSASELSALKSQVQSLTGEKASLTSEKASLEDQLIVSRKQATDLQVKTVGFGDSMALFTASQKNGVNSNVFIDGKATLDSLLTNPGFASRKAAITSVSDSFNSTSGVLSNYSASSDYLQKQFALWYRQGCDYWIGGGGTNASIQDGFCVEALRNVFSTKRAWVFVNTSQSYLDSVGKSNSLLIEAMSE